MIAARLLSLALATAAAPPAHGDVATLVLIVASNRGAQPGRPALHYADDDAAKYYRVLSAVAGEEDTILLTDFDRDTARLFPDLPDKARSPNRVQLDLAVAQLARRSADLRRAGRSVHFLFVFAGHGDVDRGRGFLELTDGPFTADDLQGMLRAVDASEAHVILDSCNSFFVVSPRKPGGTRLATPRDAAEALARRLANVGVFLSTSAQAEVYEWSDLQSGVFSHAVRSGLMGAADVNGDGRVSYEELAAFVETATAEIKNPLFRPSVFARGPNGDDSRSILEAPAGPHAAMEVRQPGAVRLAVRDTDGLRWLDAHEEAGATLRLWFPASLAPRLEIDELETSREAMGQVAASYLLPSDAGLVRLADLRLAGTSVAMRGPGEIFRALFARPFGPTALAAYLDHRVPWTERMLAMEAGPVLPMTEPVPAASPSREEGRRGLVVSLRPAVVIPWVVLSSAFPVKPQESNGLGVFAAVGYQLHPWFIAEIEGGFLDTTMSGGSFLYPSQGYPTDLVEPQVRLRSVSLALNARFELPMLAPRPYLFVGGGVLTSGITIVPKDFNATLRATRAAPFVQGGLGLALDLGEHLFVGVEARYLLRTSVQAFGAEFGFNAVAVGANLGWRL